MLQPLRVLVVEDRAADAELIVRAVRRAGFNPTWRRVETETDYVASLHPDLDVILSDYEMPEFSGLRALEVLNARRLEIPFIIISGTIGEDTAVAAMKSGAADFLLKDRLGRLGPAIEQALEQRRLRLERSFSEERIHQQAALLDHARDAIIVYLLSGEIRFWNLSATRLFGWEEEAVGCEVQSLIFPDGRVFDMAREEVLRKGGWIGEIAMRTRNGEEVLVESRWTLVRDATGQPHTILSINTDITERKRLEAQFFRAQRLESIGMLAGGVAHDLNNILGPIIMSAELLKMRADQPPDLSLLETIELSASRGAEMVKHVLSFARGIEGRRTIVRPLDLFTELQTIIRETFPKSIVIQTDLSEGVWNVAGDPTQLHQVLLNLAVNARDAMNLGGTLTLGARNAEIDEHFATMQTRAQPGPYVILEVADTGTGIPPSVRARIFDPFFTTKEPGKGTGLGLSTCAAIVKSHGGFLVVDSEPGEGTIFRIHLPADTAGVDEQVVVELSELPRGEGELILVIDDEAALRSITRQTLETFGYRVLTAHDGAEGVAVFAQHARQVALVLVDQMMPVMDGAAAAHAILRLEPAVKIIGATGLAAKNAEGDLSRAGVRHFLPKPYSADVLLKTIHAILHPEKAAGT
jgi:PAS domain S-box-containing protein